MTTTIKVSGLAAAASSALAWTDLVPVSIGAGSPWVSNSATLAQRRQFAAVTTRASASTVNLGGSVAKYINITGTSQINSFGAVPNIECVLTLVNGLTIAVAALGNLPANIVFAAGDNIRVQSDASGAFWLTAYSLASGRSIWGPVSGQHTVAGGVGAFSTGAPSTWTNSIVQIMRSGAVVTADAHVSLATGTLTIASGSVYTLTNGDVIKWIAVSG